jgi:hypothetical protein
MSSPLSNSPFSFLWRTPLGHMSSLYMVSIRQMNTIYERCVLNPARDLIRPMFFPLFSSLSSSFQSRLKDEKQFFEDFWNPTIPVRPELPLQGAIREHFTCRHEIFQVTIKKEVLSIKCCIIEPKNLSSDKDCKNLVHALGNTCTADNAIIYTYPLLASYLEGEDKAPARFILLSQYEARKDDGSTHEHRTLSEAGLILTETLLLLEKSYGTIQQIVAHSVGGIVTAAALKHFYRKPVNTLLPNWSGLKSPFSPANCKEKFKVTPKSIVFDRTASSVQELSGRYIGGSFLIGSRVFSGWKMDFGEEIAKFIERSAEAPPTITVIGARQDHEFPGKVNLFNNAHIKKLAAAEKITRLLLDAPFRFAVPRTHHSKSLGEWHNVHVVDGNKGLIPENKSLSDVIIKRFTSY